jgi:hypothetical protein
MQTSNHDSDFYTWTQEQAALLRQGRLSEADIVNLIEEIEDMGASERRELENRLIILLAHLLKWMYQPERRGNSWRLTIKNQRFQTKRHLKKNPGLQHDLGDSFEAAYYTASLDAAKETKLDESTFPVNCPWLIDQVLDDEFWPD